MKKLITLSVLALFVAACSPSDVADNIVENAIENETGGDVDVDIDSDDGTVEIEGEDGETATFGGGELPDDLPFDVPGGGDVQAVIQTNNGSTITLVYPSDEFDSLVDHFQKIFDAESAGDEDSFQSSTSNPKSASFAWNTSDGGLRSITISESGPQTLVGLLYGDE